VERRRNPTEGWEKERKKKKKKKSKKKKERESFLLLKLGAIFRLRLSWLATGAFLRRGHAGTRVSRVARLNGFLTFVACAVVHSCEAAVESARRGWSAFVQKSTFTLSASYTPRRAGREGWRGGGLTARARVCVYPSAPPLTCGFFRIGWN